MKFLSLYLCLLFIIIVSCEDKPPPKTENSILSPDVIAKEIIVKYRGCQLDSLSCTFAQIVYPQFSNVSRQNLNAAIIEKVYDHASSFVIEESEHEDLNTVANAFVEDYARFVQEFADYKLGWYLKIDAEIIYESAQCISLMIDIETFTGGAHPNSTTNYYVFNRNTNQELSLADIISDTTKFRHILTKAFRTQKKIDDSISLAEAGYSIYDDEITINKNIGLTEHQLIVHFNPYEIAPYSMGPTTVAIDKSELQSILKIH